MATPQLDWVVRFKFPFSNALSKNHIYAGTAFGHRFMRKDSSSAKDGIAYAARAALQGRKLKQNKVWIDIFVQKANQKSDAINVIDLVCDGLKIGLGVDDRWFSIRQLDWEIAKSDPQIFVGFGQEDVPDVIACSSCGRILPFEQFNKNKSTKIGISRNCKDCTRKPTLH